VADLDGDVSDGDDRIRTVTVEDPQCRTLVVQGHSHRGIRNGLDSSNGAGGAVVAEGIGWHDGWSHRKNARIGEQGLAPFSCA